MTDETPDVRELEFTKLGPDGGEARLTLADDKLLIETADDSPMPEWLRGEVAFDGLDIVYVDPSEEEDEAEEEPDAKPLPPGLRVERWIEMPAAEGDKTFPRKAMIAIDGGHVDMERAEAFAATFARLAGREKPKEEPTEAVEAEAAELPTGAPEPEPAAVAEVAAAPAEEAPAFAAGDDSPAFAPPASDEPSAFAAQDDDSPAFAPPASDEPSAFASPDEDDSPAFVAPDDDQDA